MDTGSELTLISQKTYENLAYKPELKRTNITLQSANGSSIRVLGAIDLNFKISGLKLTHNFIVVSNLNRNIILGRDFLVKNGVRIYFDLKKKSNKKRLRKLRK